MRAALGDFLDGLSATENEADAGGLLLSFFQEMGADGGNIWFASGEDETKSVNASVSTYPQPFLDYLYRSYSRNELALAQSVARGVRPVRWAWTLAQHQYAEDSADYAHARKYFHGFKLPDSLIIPVPTPGKIGSSGVSYYGGTSSKQFDGLIHERGRELMIAGYAAHVRMQALRANISPVVALSGRERECLLWLARGLRAKEISHRLNLREVTVHLHITNARRKLSAATREQAVARAIMRGLICP